MNTFKELILYRKKTNPLKIGIIFEDKKFTYNEIYEISVQYANYLTNLGIQEKAKFAILDFNTIELQFILFASNLIGAIPMILNWRMNAFEIEKILSSSPVKFFLYGEEFEKFQSEIKLKLKKLSLKEIILKSDLELKSKYIAKEEDIFVNLYTSGTTGIPKSVQLSNLNLLSTIKNLSTELPSFGSDSVNLICAPYFHIGGVGYSYLNFYIGGKAILHKKFIPLKILESIEKEKITNALLVPAMIHSILDIPNVGNFNLSSLKNIQHGGSPMPFQLLKKAKKVFKSYFTGAYGLTECSGIASLNRYDIQELALKNKDKEILTSVGKPISEIEIEIRNGNINLNKNLIGEVCVRGKSVFMGYDNIKNTEFDIDGFFHTGDIGKFDESGNLFLLDRKNDMILSKSENIYPIEVERVLDMIKEVKESAVVGLPSKEFGEEVTAFIVLNENKILSKKAIFEFCKKYLSSYKIPRRIFFLESLPKNPTGKILRNELKIKFST